MEILPTKHIVTEHTTFKVNINTDTGIALEREPFKKYMSTISDPVHYSASQQLGTDMRQSNISVFTYQSARQHDNCINAGIFSIDAIKSKKPTVLQEWICSTEKSNVTFINKLDRTTCYNFELEEFIIDSKFPHPAT